MQRHPQHSRQDSACRSLQRSARNSGGDNMTRTVQRARRFASLVADGHAATAFEILRTRIRSQTAFYGLLRDLDIPVQAPPARIPVDVRPLAPDDDLSFLDADPSLDREANWLRQEQRRLVDADIPACWVAVAEGNRVAYMQWLIGAAHNARIREYWDDFFPQLRPHEALLEGAYTPEAFRGQGIMPHAMARISEAAREFGARHVITFVKDGNIPALKGSLKAGFSPHLMRHHSWTMFRRRVEFSELPPDMVLSFEQRA